MIEVLGLEDIGLVDHGPTLTLGIGKGQAVSIAGPAAAGKTRLLNVLYGAERPAQGSVSRYGSIARTGDVSVSRRARVQSLFARNAAQSTNASRAADLMVALHLQDARRLLVSELTPGQFAACELVGPLSSGADLVLIDGQLDRLDPWALRSTLEVIANLRAAGAAFVVVTNRQDLITAFDALIVLKSHHVRFAGTVDDLLRVGPPHTLHVATENRPGVRALVSPFEVSVQDVPDGVRLEAAEGQSLAARLLLEGYGDVKFVVVRPPTVDDALLSLFL